MVSMEIFGLACSFVCTLININYCAMDSSANSFFHIFFAGHIKSAVFPLGPPASEICCRYELKSGPDWDLISGSKTGLSQTASNKNGKYNDEITFNMPIELTFKATNPHGWPQMMIMLYGRTRWGAETVLGYSRCHLPVFDTEEITTPLLIPQSTNMISELGTWITGKNPELKNPFVLLESNAAKGLSIQSYGELRIQINTIMRGIGRLGYDWN